MSNVANKGSTDPLLLASEEVAVGSTAANLQFDPVTIIIAAVLVFALSLITVACNSVILAAFYRYKRLRTASNCLLVSLAVSDFGVGVFMPFATYLELMNVMDSSSNPSPSLCAMPYCILITLCSVSVLVTVAIAVDRLTSLAQPLRYKNIITHSSIEKYIAVFWIYAIVVGLSPLIYPTIASGTETYSYSGTCRFNGVIMPPVRVFLFLAVWAPSAFILLGCYVYVYLVARAHARAIYTVELSFRNQTQTLALPRYGQTLAVTVGAFFILWLPFQTCMLLDTFFGTNILLECTVWLGLPILAHSGTNPWIYAFHHGEIRLAAGKIAEDLVSLFGVTPSRYYGCSPARRGSHTNLELAEVNSNEERRPAVEDCFAAKQQSVVYSSKRGLELSSKIADISPERADRESTSASFRQMDIVEEDIHDLTKMLDPKFIVDRNHIIDSNHNIDRIKNLKYLLDPTFTKIRHLGRLNHKRMTGKNTTTRHQDTRFVSYQNLKMDQSMKGRKATVHLNTMSDPMLNADDSADGVGGSVHVSVYQQVSQVPGRKAALNLASVSDSNIKESSDESSELSVVFRHYRTGKANNHRYSEQCLDNKSHFYPSQSKPVGRSHFGLEHRHKRSFTWARARQRFSCSKFLDAASPPPSLEFKSRQSSYTSVASTPEDVWPSPRSSSPKLRSSSSRQLTITPNRLASLLVRPTHIKMSLDCCTTGYSKMRQENGSSDVSLAHAESLINGLPGQSRRFLEPSRLVDSLPAPAVHSEPPSPIEPLPLDSLQEEDSTSKSTADVTALRDTTRSQNCYSPHGFRISSSPVRHSDPIIPSVLLNIEDCSSDLHSGNVWSGGSNCSPSRDSFSPKKLSDLLMRLSAADERTATSHGTAYIDRTFREHDCTRFSSRRPSDSKWSESSRSQEVLSCSTAAEHQPRFPSSYSVNNIQSCNSGSDLNDLTSSCLEPFLCSDAALSSSLRDSFFSAPSVPDSEDMFNSFEEPDEAPEQHLLATGSRDSGSSVSLVRRPLAMRNSSQLELQSKSTESMFRDKDQSERLCAILRLEPSIHRSRPRVRPVTCKNSRIAPLATPTPTDVCSPTFDVTVVAELKNEVAAGVGVTV